MHTMTVRELRAALFALPEQDAPVLAWTSSGGELQPHVIETPNCKVLAISWDDRRDVYVLHLTEATR